MYMAERAKELAACHGVVQNITQQLDNASQSAQILRNFYTPAQLRVQVEELQTKCEHTAKRLEEAEKERDCAVEEREQAEQRLQGISEDLREARAQVQRHSEVVGDHSEAMKRIRDSEEERDRAEDTSQRLSEDLKLARAELRRHTEAVGGGLESLLKMAAELEIVMVSVSAVAAGIPPPRPSRKKDRDAIFAELVGKTTPDPVAKKLHFDDDASTGMTSVEGACDDIERALRLAARDLVARQQKEVEINRLSKACQRVQADAEDTQAGLRDDVERLRGQMETLRDQLEASKAAMTLKIEQYEDLAEDLHRCKEDNQQCKDDNHRIREELHRTSLDLSRAREEAKVANEEAERLTKRHLLQQRKFQVAVEDGMKHTTELLREAEQKEKQDEETILALRREVELLKMNLGEASKEHLEPFEKRIRDLEHERGSLQEEIKHLKELLSEHERIDSARLATIEELEATLHDKVSEAHQRSQLVNVLSAKVSAKQAQADKVQAQQQLQEEELSTMTHKHSQALEDAKSAKEAQRKAEQRSSELQEELHSLQASISQLQASIRDWSSSVKYLEDLVKESETKLSNQSWNLERASRELDVMREEAMRRDATLKECEQLLSERQQERLVQVNYVADLERRRDDMEVLLRSQSSRLQSLEIALSQANERLELQREQLKRYSRGMMQHVHQHNENVSALLHYTSPEHDTASFSSDARSPYHDSFIRR